MQAIINYIINYYFEFIPLLVNIQRDSNMGYGDYREIEGNNYDLDKFLKILKNFTENINDEHIKKNYNGMVNIMNDLHKIGQGPYDYSNPKLITYLDASPKEKVELVEMQDYYITEYKKFRKEVLHLR